MKNALVLLLVPIYSYSQTTGKDSGWKTLDQPNYSIQYPVTWELNQSGQMGTSLILFSALESQQDKFRENVNVVIQDLTGQGIDLNKYAEISEGQIKQFITNSRILESKRVKTESGECHKLVYSGEQGTFKLTFEQYYLISGEKAYILTFTAEQARFDSFKEEGEKIMNSFKLKR